LGVFLGGFLGLEGAIAAEGLASCAFGFLGLRVCDGGVLKLDNLNLLRIGGFVLFFRILGCEISVMTSFGLRFVVEAEFKVFRIAAVVDLEELLVPGSG
jgi:hypothetical protein